MSIETAPGVSRDELPALRDGLLRLAADGQDCQAQHCPPSATQDCDWPRCAGDQS